MSRNSLEIFIVKNGLNEAEAMNFLQDAGIISDNCENARDVTKHDFRAAIEFLRQFPKNKN